MKKARRATRTALGRHGAVVAPCNHAGAGAPRTRVQLGELAKRRDLAGRSKMGRDELAVNSVTGSSAGLALNN